MSPLGEVDTREISSSVPLIISMNVQGRGSSGGGGGGGGLLHLSVCLSVCMLSAGNERRAP